MSPEERHEQQAAHDAYFNGLTIDPRHADPSTAYLSGWADGRGVVAMPADRSTVRLIPKGTTHMQYGRERRMAIADYLDSPHYDAPGWVPVRRTFRQDALGTMSVRPLGSDVHWFIWTPKGWA